MKILSQMWESIQGYLFPYLEEEHCPLTEKQKQVVKVLEVVRVEEYVDNRGKRRGRKRKSRAKVARAFVLKAVYNLASTLKTVAAPRCA